MYFSVQGLFAITTLTTGGTIVSTLICGLTSTSTSTATVLSYFPALNCRWSTMTHETVQNKLKIIRDGNASSLTSTQGALLLLCTSIDS